MMNLATWIATGLLAVVFTISGLAKSTLSRTRLIASGQTGIAPYPMPFIRVVAGCELIAVVGLIAPWLSDTARYLTPAAALGLAIVMIGAAASHASLREPVQAAGNAVILAICIFVATVRFTAL